MKYETGTVIPEKESRCLFIRLQPGESGNLGIQKLKNGVFTLLYAISERAL